MNPHLSLNTQILLTPGRTGLRAGADNTVDVLVRIQAPDAPAEGQAVRPPQALALVIDRSGSMAGHPLDEAKRCLGQVVARLRASDQVSLVQFDHRVQRLLPCAPVGNGNALRQAIDTIVHGGNTNLHGGWLDGAHGLADAAGTGLKRVILLSDGQANDGVTDVAEIARQCAEWAARGITTSTCGLGHRFNEELMVAMGRAGGGNHYYGETADDLMEPFERELDLLANLCLRGLTLATSAPDGVRIEMLNDHPAAAGGGWRLPDLAWGAEAWALLRLQVPAGRLGDIGQRLALLQVQVRGEDTAGQPVQLERASLALQVLAPSAYDALVDDELVVRREAELRAAGLLANMRAAALAGYWAAVDALLADAQTQLAGHPWLASVLESMRDVAATRVRASLAKEAMYSHSQLTRRLTSKDEDIKFSLDESLPAYLRRKPRQGKDDR